VPFYPRLAHYDAKLSFIEIGTVISLNPAGAIAFSFVCDNVIAKIGRKKGIQTGLLIQATVTILFGCLNFITDSSSLFYFVSIVSRFF
jgi:fucose permease